MLADAHCHLQFEAFRDDLDTVLDNAAEQGVERLIVAGTCLDDIDRLAALNQKPQIDICLGLHPWFLDRHPDVAIDQLRHALETQPVEALAEETSQTLRRVIPRRS